MATEVVFTCLPNGRTGDRLHLSVHVAPRLSGSGTHLASYPVFLEWPPTDLGFQVEFGGSPGMPATATSTPDPTLWANLFGPKTPVKPYQFRDRSELRVHTYPVVKLARFLQDRYTSVAIGSPQDHPAIDDLLADGFGSIHFAGHRGSEAVREWRAAADELANELSDAQVVDTSQPSETRFDFVQLRDFFAPVDISQPRDKAAFTEPVKLPEVDFHRALQSFNQHPPFLRHLGLVFDFDLDVSGGQPPNGITTVRVEPVSTALAGADLRRPVTHCEVSPTDFRAITSAGATHLADGFLRFDDSNQYAVILVEAVGGGLKAVDFAGNLHRKRNLKRTIDTPANSSLPSLRADGVAVAQIGRAQAVRDRLVQLAGHEADLATDSLELFAEDLVRGHRIDVWDSRSGQWHSLMKRTGTYQLQGGAVTIDVADEGTLGTTATKKKLRNEDLFLAESVFFWDGWSLVGARPGKTLNTEMPGDSDDPASVDTLIDRQPNLPGPDFDVSLQFEVTPGTLPFLRYGVDYRFRARTVDLAGNSIDAASDDDAHATEPVRFGRFEPLQCPPVVMRTPRGPGESMETIVLRSNFAVDPTPPTTERHIAPAKVGQLTAEHHGVLDVASPTDPSKLLVDGSKATYDMLSVRDRASLLDQATNPADPPDNVFYDTEHLACEYTPDPAARRFALRLLDGPHAGFSETFPLLDVDKGAVWPDMVPVRLVVTEGTDPTDAPKLIEDHVLEVQLGKADVVHARLSAALDVDDLEQFGIWHWIDAALGAADPKRRSLPGLIGDGHHWMFEPFRPLTLVHAVRQPLAPPEFIEGPTAKREELGDSFAIITGRFAFSRKSTSKVDVLADYSIPVDDPSLPGPPDLPGSFSVNVVKQPAFSVKVKFEGDVHPTEMKFNERHEFGDTRHRVVKYLAVATTRFAEFFTQSLETVADGPPFEVKLDTGSPPAGVVPGSVKLSKGARDSSTQLIEGQDFTVNHTTGMVTFNARAVASGDPLSFTFLAHPITRESVVEEVIVPSSARPAAPRVLYAVPIFGWSSVSERAKHTSTRGGGGLRIYLERPWWTSGQDELLGVVTWPGAAPRKQSELADDDALRPYVTQWGMDPIYGAAPTPDPYPRLSAFTEATVVSDKGSLSLRELPGGPGVDVAGHEVRYDAVRDLWYCDVHVDSGDAYHPIIRLALARYQPASRDDAHLSPVVVADFAQLVPGRVATVVRTGSGPADVTVTGPAPDSTEAAPGPGVCRVFVELRDEDIDDPNLGWTSVGDPHELSGSVTAGEATWTGSVPLLRGAAAGSTRLVIEQAEILRIENDKLTPLPPDQTPPILGERVVYLDTIVL